MDQDEREKKARAIMRKYGFTVEACSWLRRQGNEFMCLKFFPGTESWMAVELFTKKLADGSQQDVLDITRIHVGRDNGMNRGNVEVRVYVEFTRQPDPPRMSYDEMIAAQARRP